MYVCVFSEGPIIQKALIQKRHTQVKQMYSFWKALGIQKRTFGNNGLSYSLMYCSSIIIVSGERVQ